MHRFAARLAVWSTAILLCTLPTAALAQRLLGTVQVEFAGTSTLHDFHGTAPAVAAAIEPDGAGWRAAVAVPVASLDTADASRDANLRAMFEAAQYPEIRAVLSGIDAEALRRTRRLPFTLVIRNVRRELTATIAAWQESPTELAFDAAFPVSLQAFALDAPRAALGLIRVGDAVQVTVHVTVRRA